MRKKGFYFFNRLTKAERKNVRNAIKKTGSLSFNSWMDAKHISVCALICIAFDWQTSPQGFNYWMDFYCKHTKL